MPIIIRKGSDHQNKKHISKYDSDNNDDNISDDEKDCKHIAATDMTDVLDFKIYRMKKPTFYDSSDKTTLIGEMFYDDEIDESLNSNKRTKRSQKLDSTKTIMIDKNNNAVLDDKLPTERIEDCKKVRIRPHPKIVLQHVNKYESKFKSLKSSAVVNYSYDLPTLDDTLQWAFMYIQWNESNLSTSFIEFENNLKSFQEEKTSLKSRNDKARSSIEYKISSDNSIHGIEKTSLIQLQHNSTPTSNNNNNNSSIIDRLKSNKSLSAQLEALKTQGVDSFLRNIDTFHKRASFINVTASKKHHAALPFVLEQSQSVNEYQMTGINTTIGLHELMKQQQVPTKPSSSKPTSSGSSRKGSLLLASSSSIAANNSTNTKISREVSRDDISNGKELLSRRTSFAIPLSTYSSRESFYKDDNLSTSILNASKKDEVFDTKNNSSNISQSKENNNNNNKKKIIKPSHNNINHKSTLISQHKQPHSSGLGVTTIPTTTAAVTITGSNNNPKQYSNKTIVLAHPMNIMSTQMTAKTQQTIQEILETQARFKKTMGHILTQISNYRNKTDHMQNQITNKITKLEQKTIHVIKDINNFSINHDNLYNKTNGKLNEKEFLRNSNIKEKISCLDLFFTKHYNLNENVHKDLKTITKNTERNIFKSNFINLMKHKWFIAIVIKLGEYIKKTNLIPLCCIKYIIVLKYVLMFGFSFDKDLFYLILEKTIILHEDHLKAIVHSFIRGLRESIDIDPVEYYNYLERKNIPANPELLNQVRAFKEQQVLMNSRMNFKKPGSNNSTSYNNYSNISYNSSTSMNSSIVVVKVSTDIISPSTQSNNNNIMPSALQELDINSIKQSKHGGLLAIVSEEM